MRFQRLSFNRCFDPSGAEAVLLKKSLNAKKGRKEEDVHPFRRRKEELGIDIDKVSVRQPFEPSGAKDGL